MSTIINCVAIPTCNRPELVNRAVESVVHDAEKSELHPHLLIVDQSDHDVEREVIARLQGTAARTGAAIYYLGKTRKRFLRAKLNISSALFHDKDESSHSIPSHAFGSNRNWATLFFAGRRFASFDDDVIVSRHSFVGLSDEMNGGDAGEAGSFYAYRTRTKLGGRVSQSPHASSSIINEMLQSLDLAPETALESFAIPGVVGHSGMASHALIAETRCPSSRRHLFASDRSHEITLYSTCVVRQNATRTVLPMTSMISTAFARKNGLPLWPFITNGRGEDHILAKCLRAGSVNPYVVNLPFSVLHAPEHGRIPNATVQVASISSILSGLLDWIGTCATLDDLADRLTELVWSSNWHDALKVAVGEHAKRQANYCALVASAPDVCSHAFSSLERLVLEWTSLHIQCASGRVSPSLSLQLLAASQIVRRLTLLVRDWDQCWHEWRCRADEIWHDCLVTNH